MNKSSRTTQVEQAIGQVVTRESSDLRVPVQVDGRRSETERPVPAVKIRKQALGDCGGSA